MNYADKIINLATNKHYMLGILITPIIFFMIGTYIGNKMLTNTGFVTLLFCFSLMILSDIGFIAKRTTYHKWGQEDYNNNEGEKFVNFNVMNNPNNLSQKERIYTIAWLNEEREHVKNNEKLSSKLKTLESNLFEQLYIIVQHPITMLGALLAFASSIVFIEDSFGFSSFERTIILSISSAYFITYIATLIYTHAHPEKTSAYNHGYYAKNISDIDIREFCVNDFNMKGILFLKGMANKKTMPSYEDVVIERFR